MLYNLFNIEQVFQPNQIPNGKYEGKWTGTTVVFTVGEKAFRGVTRTEMPHGTKCVVRVDGASYKVEVVKE